MGRGSAGRNYADHLLDGRLAEQISAARKGGVSWDRIARSLWDLTDHKVDVTGPTVAKWASELGVEVVA